MAFFTSVPTVYFSQLLNPKIKNTFLTKNFYIVDFLLALPFLYLSFLLTNFLFSLFNIAQLTLDVSLYFNGAIILLLALLFSTFIQGYIAIKNQALYKDLENVKLKNENLKKDLKMMTNYINPHFLFNALNSLAGLINENPKKAENVVMILSHLYRGILFALKKEFHSLEDELKICDDYLEIEKYRFEDRLVIKKTFEISKVEFAKIQVPTLMLQPLFENVIKHGVMNNANVTTCHCHFVQENEMLKISISNNVCSQARSTGTESSLVILRDRLKLIYQDFAEFVADDKQDSFTVSIKLPINAFKNTGDLYV